jgi:hypothetical protein
MNRATSHGQAIRSTRACSLVTHFMVDLLEAATDGDATSLTRYLGRPKSMKKSAAPAPRARG